MLNDANYFKSIYIVTGYTDLHFGIDFLTALIESKLGSKPFVPDTLYLFCGRRTDRIKGLVWESLSAAFCYPHIFVKKGLFIVFLAAMFRKTCG